MIVKRTAWTIVPVRLGVMTVPYAQLVRGARTHRQINIPCIGWVLRGPKADIIVDTGPGSAEWSGKHHNPMVRPAREGVKEAFALAGVDVSQVKTVINTHLHWDHCYGNVEFDNASFYVQRKELAYARRPLPCDDPIYETSLAAPFERVKDRIVVVDGETEIAPGIRLVPMHGHTPGHQGVLVEGTERTILIAGDAVGLYANLEGAGKPGVIYTDLRAWYGSLTSLLARCDLVLPGHDPDVFEQVSYS